MKLTKPINKFTKSSQELCVDTDGGFAYKIPGRKSQAYLQGRETNQAVDICLSHSVGDDRKRFPMSSCSK